jgi:hypothetical protein
MSPRGQITIVVNDLKLLQADDQDRAPRGVKELHLNHMDLTEYFLSKADSV